MNVSRHDRDFKMLPPRRHPDTSGEYDGNNPLRLAEEIDAALDKYGLATIAACSRASNSLRVSCAANFTVASAQTATPDSENGRYSFSPVADGVLRLDTRTGQVSQCSRSDAGWAGKAVPDERLALEMEIARLQGENATLKKELPGVSRSIRR